MIVGIVFETITTPTAIRKAEVATKATPTANVAIPESPTSVESQPKVRSGVISALDALAIPNRLRAYISWWCSNAARRLVNILQHGVFPHLSLPSFVVGAWVVHSVEELAFAREVIQEYLSLGAVEPCSLCGLRFSVPWFVLSKVEPSGSIKRRFITNMRPINKFIACSPFKLDHWGIVFPMLRKGMYAAKVDLSHAYFHIPLSSNVARYIGVEVDGSCYRFRSQCLTPNILLIHAHSFQASERAWTNGLRLHG